MENSLLSVVIFMQPHVLLWHCVWCLLPVHVMYISLPQPEHTINIQLKESLCLQIVIQICIIRLRFKLPQKPKFRTNQTDLN